MLLSEIHPLGTALFNPVTQASRWYDLFSEEDRKALLEKGGRGLISRCD